MADENSDVYRIRTCSVKQPGGTVLHTWRRPGPFSKHRHQAQMFVSGVCYMLITGQGKLDILYPPLESYK